MHAADRPSYTSPLRLVYFGVRMSVMRALLRTFENPAVEQVTGQGDLDEYIEARQRCREAAMSCTMAMVDFIAMLDGRDFEHFWPAWCSSIFASMPYMAMLLVVTSREINEAGKCKFLLTKMRRLLRTQSRSSETMRLAILRMDAHFWRGMDNIFVMDSRLGCSFDELIDIPWSTQPD